MKLLLDTHAFLWADAEPERLSATAAALILDPGNSLYLSVASVWEVQIKNRLRKLTLRVPLPQMISENEQRNGLVVLSVTAAHVFHLDQLPPIHNDPFDRLIVAVARMEGATVVSADSMLRQYPVPVQW